MQRYQSYPRKEEPLNFPMEGIARKFTYFTIFLCVVLIAGMLLATIYFDPEKVVERELTAMAKEYYETVVYPRALEGEEDPVATIADYEAGGFPPVYLRQLLLYDGGKNADKRGYFTGQYACDTNKTSVTYKPYAPYGVEDYDIRIRLSCEWK